MGKQNRLSVLVVAGALLVTAPLGEREAWAQSVGGHGVPSRAFPLQRIHLSLKYDSGDDGRNQCGSCCAGAGGAQMGCRAGQGCASPRPENGRRVRAFAPVSREKPIWSRARASKARTSARLPRTSRSGPSPQAIEQEWMNSAPHRANILDPRMNVIGIGIVKKGGSYYAVEDFADGVAELGPEQIEKKVGALLAAAGNSAHGIGTRMRARPARWSMGRRAAQRRSS